MLGELDIKSIGLLVKRVFTVASVWFHRFTKEDVGMLVPKGVGDLLGRRFQHSTYWLFRRREASLASQRCCFLRGRRRAGYGRLCSGIRRCWGARQPRCLPEQMQLHDLVLQKQLAHPQKHLAQHLKHLWTWGLSNILSHLHSHLQILMLRSRLTFKLFFQRSSINLLILRLKSSYFPHK